MIETLTKPGSTLTPGQIARVRQQAEEFEGVVHREFANPT